MWFCFLQRSQMSLTPTTRMQPWWSSSPTNLTSTLTPSTWKSYLKKRLSLSQKRFKTLWSEWTCFSRKTLSWKEKLCLSGRSMWTCSRATRTSVIPFNLLSPNVHLTTALNAPRLVSARLQTCLPTTPEVQSSRTGTSRRIKCKRLFWLWVKRWSTWARGTKRCCKTSRGKTRFTRLM